jgi:DHA1 family tetracycline resistance protein-like MFS transporter
MENNMNSSDATEPNLEGQSTRTPGRQTITFLVVTAFLNTMGAGILSPVLPFIVQQYVGNQHTLATVVGWLVAVYALCQFVAAPGLGLLSDRFGRRPLLLICLLGSAIGYALFGLGGALWVLFLGRIIDGLTGGNVSILFAYIGDISTPEERTKYFGLFGAAAGLGFIVGPVIGGFTSQVSYSAPVYIAAAVFVATTVWGYFNFPESLSKEHRVAYTSLAELNPFKQLRKVFAISQLRWLLLATFFFSFPFAVFASITTVLLKDSLGWSPVNIGLIYFVVGAGDILMQGVLIGRILPVFGEVKLTIGGLVCEMIAYLLIGLIAFVPSQLFLWVGIVFYIVGSGLLEPSLGGLISRAAGPRQQGIVQGGSQSIQSLARILGPVCGGVLYAQFGHATPYWSGAVIVGLAILVMFLAIPSIQANRS